MTEQTQTEIIAETVLGEMMELILRAPKEMQVGWGMLTEQQQKNIIFESEIVARKRIEQIVDLVSSTDHDSLKVSIDHAKIKSDRVLAQISFAASEKNREHFIDFIDSQVMLTLVDPEEFMGEAGKPEAEPDQRSLAL